MGKPYIFTCEHCGCVEESEWSEEEANAECVEVFGELPEDRVTVCDDCYAEALAIMPAKVWRDRGRA